MKPDEIFAKVTNGELEGEELTNTISNLEVDQQAELRKLMAEDTQKTMNEMSGIRKEKKRVEELLEERRKELETNQEAPKDPEPQPAPQPTNSSPQNDFATKFREEQKQKAFKKFQSDFGLSEEEAERINTQFEKMDSGKMDADNIYEDYVGVYAFLNKDKLVQADKERKAREAAAAAETAKGAGGAQGTPKDGNEPPKYSEAAISLAKRAGISEEAAERQLADGTKRVFQ